MEIIVKLYGDLKRYAPEDQTSFSLKLDSGACLADIHEILSIPAGDHISLINGRRSEQNVTLADGDTVVLLPPLSGG